MLACVFGRGPPVDSSAFETKGLRGDEKHNSVNRIRVFLKLVCLSTSSCRGRLESCLLAASASHIVSSRFLRLSFGAMCSAAPSPARVSSDRRHGRRLPKLLLLVCATRGAGLLLPPRAPPITKLRAAVLDPLNAEDLGDSATVPELAEAVAHKGAADVTALSLLEEIRGLKFFSLYSIDLLANCAYLGGAPEECEFDACEVLPVDPVPLHLMERDRKERGFELDAWARFDLPSEDYYDLEEYPEGYTGYDGSSVWKFLYENLTFGKEAIEEENDPNGWHNVFDRAVSGLHASIACHVVDDYSGPRASV